MRNIISICTLLISFNTLAAPAPFGLELGKTTIEKAKTQYTLTKNGNNTVDQGEIFEIDGRAIEFDGLKKLYLTFNKDRKLMMLAAKLDKNRFDAALNSLREKYKLVKSDLPFVGDKLAVFREGETLVFLEAAHLSFTMNMVYIQESFMQAVNRTQKKTEQDKHQREASQL